MNKKFSYCGKNEMERLTNQLNLNCNLFLLASDLQWDKSLQLINNITLISSSKKTIQCRIFKQWQNLPNHATNNPLCPRNLEVITGLDLDSTTNNFNAPQFTTKSQVLNKDKVHLLHAPMYHQSTRKGISTIISNTVKKSISWKIIKKKEQNLETDKYVHSFQST